MHSFLAVSRQIDVGITLSHLILSPEVDMSLRQISFFLTFSKLDLEDCLFTPPALFCGNMSGNDGRPISRRLKVLLPL